MPCRLVSITNLPPKDYDKQRAKKYFQNLLRKKLRLKKLIKNTLKRIPSVKNLLERIYNLERQNHSLIDEMHILKTEIEHMHQEIDYKYYEGLHPENYLCALKNWFKKYAGKTLDLENPQTLNEKIQWLKLYDSTPLKTQLTDKYLAREWVKERIGEKYLIPLLGTWDKFDEIDFDRLPAKFVLKANHGCGWNIIVKDKNTFDKAAAREKFNKWLNTNFAFVNGLELHYKDIFPKIIAEQYLENDNGYLYDYKVLCFNGKPHFILVDIERHTNHKRNVYDLDWNIQPFSNYPKFETIDKPDNLDEMIFLAKTLSKDFALVRVDFYLLNDGSLKFGELTFTPASGQLWWDPPEYDLVLGQMITLPQKKNK